MHMSFVSACALTWRSLGWVEVRKHMLQSIVCSHASDACSPVLSSPQGAVVQVPRVSFREWCRGFLPVGVCFAASLWLSNTAYLYISVSAVCLSVNHASHPP